MNKLQVNKIIKYGRQSKSCLLPSIGFFRRVFGLLIAPKFRRFLIRESRLRSVKSSFWPKFY